MIIKTEILRMISKQTQAQYFVQKKTIHSGEGIPTEQNICDDPEPVDNQGKMQSNIRPTNNRNQTDSIDPEHYENIFKYRVLYIAGQYKDDQNLNPRKQKYYHMMGKVCCPIWKILSFTTFCMLLYLGVFIAASVLGLKEGGTFLQIETDVLLKLGANKPLLVRQGEAWRLLTASVLHLDFNHLFGNLSLTWMLLSHVEYTIGPIKCVILVIVTAIGANIFTALLAPFQIKVGSSTFLMGALGLTLGYFITNWRGLNQIGKILKCQIACMISFSIIFIVAMSSIGSNIDHFGHLGGFVTGVWISCIHKPIYQGKGQIFLRILFGILLTAQLSVTFIFFYLLEEETLFDNSTNDSEI